MKYFLLSLFLIAVSCKKEDSTTEATEALPVTQTNTATVEKDTEKIIIKTDTVLVFINNEKKQKTTYVVAKLLSQEPETGATNTANFELDFYKKNTKIGTANLSVNKYAKGSKWRAIEGLEDEKTMGKSAFVKLRLLHKDPAFLKHDYLFFLKNSQAQLFIQWEGINVLVWGEWLDIKNPNQTVEPDYFYCKTGAFEEMDDSDNEIGLLTYSDSIEFRFKNNQWVQELKSKKNTPYFKKEMNFNELYK